MNHVEKSFFYGVDMEIWKYITGTKKSYSISNIGCVKSYRHQFGGRRKFPKILKPGNNADGYRCVVLYNHNTNPKTKKTIRVSSLVALMFIGKRPKGYQVNHKDSNRANDNYKNLEYVTPQDNTLHCWAKGRGVGYPKGIKHPNHKLTPEKVLKIRKEYIPHIILERELAKKYGVHKGTIHCILSRATWKHI